LTGGGAAAAAAATRTVDVRVFASRRLCAPDVIPLVPVAGGDAAGDFARGLGTAAADDEAADGWRPSGGEEEEEEEEEVVVVAPPRRRRAAVARLVRA